IPTRPHHVLDRAGRQGGEVAVVIRRLDEQLMRADAVHDVVDALAMALEVPLDAQCRKLVGDDADAPAGRVGGRLGRIPVGEDLGWRLALVTGAEGARSPAALDQAAREVARPPYALGRDDHPPSEGGILAELRHARRRATQLRGRGSLLAGGTRPL